MFSQYNKIFDALEWLAATCSNVLNKGEQMVRYYGYYSNVSRGKRKKKPRMNGYPVSWNQMNPQGNPGKIGQD